MNVSILVLMDLAFESYMEIGRQADAFSLNGFISREKISRRLDAGKRVSLRELLYPLMQGYDSVKIAADVEVGGTDQRFNLLAGRDLQRLYDQEPQGVLTNPLIEGLDGRKMSSSFGNTVNLFDLPNDMFGKIMSMQDGLIGAISPCLPVSICRLSRAMKRRSKREPIRATSS